MSNKVYKISGMHCPSCAMNIEWELEDAGIKGKCSYARQELEVESDGKDVDEEKIKLAVEKAGYKVVP